MIHSDTNEMKANNIKLGDVYFFLGLPNILLEFYKKEVYTYNILKGRWKYFERYNKSVW
ncbi:hypothetical protein HMPREF0848_00726 [Streptococcus sp. C150]|nr:hypothetical protein HMPREF0848_00726 [Streptococcus sp. C150]